MPIFETNENDDSLSGGSMMEEENHSALVAKKSCVESSFMIWMERNVSDIITFVGCLLLVQNFWSAFANRATCG